MKRPVSTLCLAAAALLGGVVVAAAFEPSSGVLTEHEKILRVRDQQTTPYAMNYADEAAQTIGVREGRWEVIDTRSRYGLLPNVSGTLARGNPMLKLQWRVGQ
jgi:hypothetical protein